MKSEAPKTRENFGNHKEFFKILHDNNLKTFIVIFEGLFKVIVIFKLKKEMNEITDYCF